MYTLFFIFSPFVLCNVVLSDSLAAIATHENSLIASFSDQKTRVKKLALEQKDVAGKISNLINNFDVNDLVSKQAQAIAILKEARFNYENIKDSASRIERQEKEFRDVVQEMFLHRKSVEEEFRNIESTLKITRGSMSTNLDLIDDNRYRLNQLRDQLNNNQNKARNLQRKVKQLEMERIAWAIVAVVSLEIGTAGLVATQIALDQANNAVRITRNNYILVERRIEGLEAEQRNYENEIYRLENKLEKCQQELAALDQIYNRVKNAQEESHHYVQYLTSLAQSLAEVNIHIESVQNKLENIVEIHDAGFDASSQKSGLERSYDELDDAWTTATGTVAVHITLKLKAEQDFSAILRGTDFLKEI